MHGRTRAEPATDIKAGPVVGGSLEGGAAAVLGAKAIVGGYLERMPRSVEVEKAIRCAELGQQIVIGGEARVAILALDRPVAGDGGLDTGADEVAALVPIEVKARVGVQLVLLPGIAAQHIAQRVRREEIAGAQACIEAVGFLDRGAEPECIKRGLDIAEMGVDQPAQQEALRNHIVVADGRFAVDAFAVNAVQRQARDEVAADLMNVGAGANAESDIEPAPVEPGRLDRLGDIGRMRGRHQSHRRNGAQKNRFRRNAREHRPYPQ
ncbi:hypothetical protein AJ88_39345 [Mesorhizobium amorphae CCBAU 01583]|nr:hypothetical protein AJ88_39345 [Mesorhizobium amorphae CCBAU 01583]